MKKSYLLIAIVIGILLIGVLSYFSYQNKIKSRDAYQDGLLNNSSGAYSGQQDAAQNNNLDQSEVNPESRGCTGEGPVDLTVSPRKMEDLGLFVPMGLMLGDHVTPIDHGYFFPPNWKMDVTSAELRDVYVPADGVITLIARMPAYFTTTNQADLQDYRIIIYHTCTFYTI